MSQENVQRACELLDAFNRRDLDAFLALTDDGIEVQSQLVAIEGGYHGHDGLRTWWGQVLASFPDFHLEILEVRDLGEFIVLALRSRGRGAESETPVDAAVWHVNEFQDGKVIRWRVYASETEALEAAGLRE